MSALDDTASVLSGPPKQLIDENTYITGPKGYGEVRDNYDQKSEKCDVMKRDRAFECYKLVQLGIRGCLLQAYVFKQQKVRDVVQSNLRDCMEGQRYDPVKASKVRDVSRCGYTVAVICTL